MAHLEAGLLEVSDQSSLEIIMKQRLVVPEHICSSCFVQDRLSPSESDSTSLVCAKCPSSQTLHPPNSCITQLDSLPEYRSWTPMQKSRPHRCTQAFSLQVGSSEHKKYMDGYFTPKQGCNLMSHRKGSIQHHHVEQQTGSWEVHTKNEGFIIHACKKKDIWKMYQIQDTGGY